MVKTRIRDDSQITLPGEVLEKLGLKEGDDLEVSVVGGNIVLVPLSSLTPQSDDLMRFWGAGRSSVPGISPAVDSEISALRNEWD